MPLDITWKPKDASIRAKAVGDRVQIVVDASWLTLRLPPLSPAVATALGLRLLRLAREMDDGQRDEAA